MPALPQARTHKFMNHRKRRLGGGQMEQTPSIAAVAVSLDGQVDQKSYANSVR